MGVCSFWLLHEEVFCVFNLSILSKYLDKAFSHVSNHVSSPAVMDSIGLLRKRYLSTVIVPAVKIAWLNVLIENALGKQKKAKKIKKNDSSQVTGRS